MNCEGINDWYPRNSWIAKLLWIVRKKGVLTKSKRQEPQAWNGLHIPFSSCSLSLSEFWLSETGLHLLLLQQVRCVSVEISIASIAGFTERKITVKVNMYVNNFIQIESNLQNFNLFLSSVWLKTALLGLFVFLRVG